MNDPTPTIESQAQPQHVWVVPPSGELPPGFPLEVHVIDTVPHLLEWFLEWLGGDRSRTVLRISAQLLDTALRVSEVLAEEERPPFARLGDLTGPLDGPWTMRAAGLPARAAATLMVTRDTPEGRARLGQQGKHKVPLPKRFEDSLQALDEDAPDATLS